MSDQEWAYPNVEKQGFEAELDQADLALTRQALKETVGKDRLGEVTGTVLYTPHKETGDIEMSEIIIKVEILDHEIADKTAEVEVVTISKGKSKQDPRQQKPSDGRKQQPL